MAATAPTALTRASGIRRWPGVVASSLFLVTALSFARATPAQALPSGSGTGFVTASHTSLVVGGTPWRAIGYNMPCAQPFLLDAGQLSYVFANIATNSGANALRVWFFQQNGGPGNWGPFDQVVATAKANGLRLIPTLVNEWPTCEPVTASTQPRKLLPWYQSGYKQTNDGYPLSFRNYAAQVAAHYANEPTVAFWQLVNEAEAPTLANGIWSCAEATAAQALRTFGDDVAGAIHAVDHNHLVSLGTIGGDQCGMVGADYAYLHSGAVDLCEYHDYGYAFDPLEASINDALSTRLHQCQALPGGGKPFFVGEAGIVNNVQSMPPEPAPNTGPALTIGSLQQRAKLFGNKMTAAFDAGASGYEVWFKGPAFDSSGDVFSIGDGDPTEAAMLQVSSNPTPAVPEVPVVILLPLTGLAVLAAAAGIMRRRNRRLV